MLLISRVQTGNDELRRVQDQTIAAVNPILSKEILNGLLTDTTALTTSYQNIPHKLGRSPVGWLVISPDALATVCQDPAAANNPDASKYLRVKASAAVNCKFWVF